MRENIASFWQVIDRYHDLFAVPGDGKKEQMDEALRALQQIDQRMYFHVGYRDEGADLLISAEGIYDLSEILVLIVRAAPSMLGWSVKPIVESDALFGRRNKVMFPDDENGDVLYGIAEQAGDLISSGPIDFCHVFSSKASAIQFGDCLSDSECSKPERYKGREGYSWQVIVTRDMIPSHANITIAEAQLADVASRYGGVPDGWGFMSR